MIVRRILVEVGTELLEALRAADPRMPAELAVFDRIAASGEPAPDFFEYSVRLGSSFAPSRLTYYFDVHRRGAAVAREAGARFTRLVAELGLAVPRALSSFVTSEGPASSEVLQVVLGIDTSLGPQGVRAKYYLVFRDNPGRQVRELLATLELAPAGDADPDKVYIVGCDVSAAGLDDVKLYFRLDRTLVPRLVENAGEVADLLGASRDVVFQQCTRRPGRRQLYLHVSRSGILQDWLARRGLAATLEHAGRIDAHLAAGRVEPWIVAFSYEDRRLAIDAPTVYFHLGKPG